MSISLRQIILLQNLKNMYTRLYTFKKKVHTFAGANSLGLAVAVYIVNNCNKNIKKIPNTLYLGLYFRPFHFCQPSFPQSLWDAHNKSLPMFWLRDRGNGSFWSTENKFKELQRAENSLQMLMNFSSPKQTCSGPAAKKSTPQLEPCKQNDCLISGMVNKYSEYRKSYGCLDPLK